MKIYENGIYREMTSKEKDEFLKTPVVKCEESFLELKLKELDSINKAQDDLINISLLATDEMFMMLEPLLEVAQINERGISKMVDMYVAMIMRGLKTIGEIPLRYREEVKQIIEQLER